MGHIPFITMRSLGSPTHNCPNCANILANTCKNAHAWFYTKFDLQFQEHIHDDTEKCFIDGDNTNINEQSNIPRKNDEDNQTEHNEYNSSTEDDATADNDKQKSNEQDDDNNITQGPNNRTEDIVTTNEHTDAEQNDNEATTDDSNNSNNTHDIPNNINIPVDEMTTEQPTTQLTSETTNRNNDADIIMYQVCNTDGMSTNNVIQQHMNTEYEQEHNEQQPTDVGENSRASSSGLRNKLHGQRRR